MKWMDQVLRIFVVVSLLMLGVALPAARVAAQDAATPLTLDADGKAQATGSLDPQGMASYVVEIAAGSTVRADFLPKEPTQSANSFVLTVVGADGNPYQTDHAGASTFDQTLPVGQEYTFKVINFGETAQEYVFELSAGDAATETSGTSSKPAAGTVDELGAQLVTSYFDALKSGDKAAVAAILAPALQVVRANGATFDATTYPDNLPALEDYTLDNVHASQDGDVVVVSYTMETDRTMDGGKPDMGPAAPRLSVFQQIDGPWKLVAHANFEPPQESATPTTAGAAPSASLTVTEAGNGQTVQVAAGGTVVVELPGNPTTGYIWQVTANDESILLPTGYTFTPDSNAMGAGGLEQFKFNAVAPGTVELALANSRPWETDTPPAETFAVTVEVVAEPAADNASILAGMAENGQTVAILPGNVLNVTLDGAADGGAWQLVAGNAMVVQPLGDWQQTPDTTDANKVAFSRSFLGVVPGDATLEFEYLPADGSAASEKYTLTVHVPASEPGSSGAVAVTEADAGQDFALVTGDTLVVRLDANPTAGYDWRVVSTNEPILPAAGDPEYAVSSDLTGAGGVATFRFLAKAAGEATVQIGEFAPGADQPDKTLDYNVTVADPARLTGNTVTATEVQSGQPIDLLAGDLLKVSIVSNPTTGYMWVLTKNDGALLRLLPESGFTADSKQVGAGGVQDFIFRALGPGKVDLQVGQFPPGAAQPDKTLDYPVTVAAADPALTAAESALTTLAADPALIDALAAGDQEPAMAAFQTLVEAHPSLYAVEFIDPDGINQFGYPPENTLEGYDFNSLATPNDDLFVDAVKSEQAAHFEIPLIEGPDAHFFLTPVFNGDQFLGMIYLIQSNG